MLKMIYCVVFIVGILLKLIIIIYYVKKIIKNNHDKLMTYCTVTKFLRNKIMHIFRNKQPLIMTLTWTHPLGYVLDLEVLR